MFSTQANNVALLTLAIVLFTNGCSRTAPESSQSAKSPDPPAESGPMTTPDLQGAPASTEEQMAQFSQGEWFLHASHMEGRRENVSDGKPVGGSLRIFGDQFNFDWKTNGQMAGTFSLRSNGQSLDCEITVTSFDGKQSSTPTPMHSLVGVVGNELWVALQGPDDKISSFNDPNAMVLIFGRTKSQLSDKYKRSFSKRVAKASAGEIMRQAGGGQDLVVDVAGYEYDEELGQFEIDIQISFNGAAIRSNNYQVAGRITVDDDGKNAKFARTGANGNYTNLLKNVEGLTLTAEILKAISESQKK